MEEIWKDVVGYEGLYQVSSLGRVKSLERLVKNDNKGGFRLIKEKILSLCSSGRQYYYVSLRKNSLPKKVYVHRLVAEAFLPNPSGYKEIDHIDTDKSNNHKNNLRWCNRSINMSNPITAKANGVRKSKPILRIDEQGNTKRYDSISSVVADGFPRTTITYYCDKSNKRYKGFLWKRL